MQLYQNCTKKHVIIIYFIKCTLSVHAREGYSCHFVSLSVSLSVSHLEKALFLKLTSLQSR